VAGTPPAPVPRHAQADKSRHLVLIINGRARAGKDTAVSLLATQFQILGWKTLAVSSIDPVRDLLVQFGFPVHQKGEKERALLSAVGDALQAYNEFRTNYVFDRAEQFFHQSRDGVVFAHLREPELIEKLRFEIEQRLRVPVKVIQVINDRVGLIESNPSDARVDLTRYDLNLNNSGSLAELSYATAALAQNLADLCGRAA
jgi:hypothetical protein